MHFNSNKIAALATLTILTIATSIAFAVPAEARRHKAKPVRHQLQQTEPAFPGGDDRYAHLTQADMPATRGAGRRSSTLSAARPAFASAAPSLGGSGLVAEARRYLGTNPTGMSSLWCARFMNMVLERSGRQGTGSNMASSFAAYGRRVSGPQVGAIAVMSRGKNGGHVGVVSGVDEAGNPIVISGNHNRRVAEAAYPRSRVYAYVMP